MYVPERYKDEDDVLNKKNKELIQPEVDNYDIIKENIVGYINQIVEIMASPTIHTTEEIARKLSISSRTVNKILSDRNVMRLINSRLENITTNYDAAMWDVLARKAIEERDIAAIELYFKIKNAKNNPGNTQVTINNNAGTGQNDILQRMSELSDDDLKKIIGSVTIEDATQIIDVESDVNNNDESE